MKSLEHHVMEFLRTRASGDEEWRCPLCGRHLLLQWGTVNRRVVLDPGDTHAIHVGNKHGQPSRPGMVNTSYRPTTRPAEREEDPILSPELRAALEELDFGDWPDPPR